MKPLRVGTGILSALLCAACVTAHQGRARAESDRHLDRIAETFADPALDNSLWATTRSGDFQESAVDIVDGRLRLRAATIGTRDDSVKYLGVRTRRPVDLKHCRSIAFSLDWNDQRNGCYLDAGIYLCPTATDATPEFEPNWLKLLYVGVPPGRNARAWLSVRNAGAERVLYDEGWPVTQRHGRIIRRQVVVLGWQSHALVVSENGERLCWLPATAIPFPEAYLYVQMSSHSNYPPREVFFDNIIVSSAAL